MNTKTEILNHKRVKTIISKLGKDEGIAEKDPHFLLSKTSLAKEDLTAEELLTLFNKGVLTESETMFWLGVLAISHEEQAKKHEALSTIDELTKVYNRRAFIETLSRELERLRRKVIEAMNIVDNPPSMALLLLDIDKFKRINDTYGHLVGDKVLKKLAAIAMDNIRSTDTVFRYGGEEFMVLLPDTSEATAMEIAERLRHKTEVAQFPLPEKSIMKKIKKRFTPKQVTISIGAAILDGRDLITKPVTDTMIPRLIRLADKALYKAKNNGRNRIEREKK